LCWEGFEPGKGVTVGPAEIIWKLRNLGLKTKDIVRRSGVHRSTIYNYELRGNPTTGNTISLENEKRLARLLEEVRLTVRAPDLDDDFALLHRAADRVGLSIRAYAEKKLNVTRSVVTAWEKRGRIPLHHMPTIRKHARTSEKTIHKFAKEVLREEPAPPSPELISILRSIDSKLDKILSRKPEKPINRIVFKQGDEIPLSQLL